MTSSIKIGLSTAACKTKRLVKSGCELLFVFKKNIFTSFQKIPGTSKNRYRSLIEQFPLS